MISILIKLGFHKLCWYNHVKNTWQVLAKGREAWVVLKRHWDHWIRGQSRYANTQMFVSSLMYKSRNVLLNGCKYVSTTPVSVSSNISSRNEPWTGNQEWLHVTASLFIVCPWRIKRLSFSYLNSWNNTNLIMLFWWTNVTINKNIL